jgi:phospholipase C
VVNSPVSNFTQCNTAETLFERLEAHGRTWKVYVQEPMPLSFTGLIHMPRLKARLGTNFVPYSEFEHDAAQGTLPDFSVIEPNMLSGHSDYHPAFGRSFVPGDMNLPMDPPSSIAGGESVFGPDLQHSPIGRFG